MQHQHEPEGNTKYNPWDGLRLEVTRHPEDAGKWAVQVHRSLPSGAEAVIDQWTLEEGPTLREARQLAEYQLSHSLDHRLRDDGVEGLIPLASHHVNEYLEKQAYGGPEEGSWYYRAGLFLRCLGIFPTRQEADDQAKRLQDYLAEANEGTRELSSVLSTGRRRIAVEPHPGEDYPKERPTYE